MIPFEIIRNYRLRTFRTAANLSVKSESEAIDFVNQSGFVFFWPITGVTLPSLWSAAAGDRPVADAHDDPGHITWDWKDNLLDKHVWYYGRVIRKKNTIISHQYLPFFYALSPNYNDYQVDYLEQYEMGLLSQESKILYEGILRDGPQDTLSLRNKLANAGIHSDSRFSRALDTLQGELKVLPIGIARVGRWRYAFIYDLTGRQYPGLVEQAMKITEADAYENLMGQYLNLVGGISHSEVNKIFNWPDNALQRALQKLSERQIITLNQQIAEHPGTWVVLTKLIH